MAPQEHQISEWKHYVFIDSPPNDDFECFAPLMSYFKMFFDENMLDHTILQRNIYSNQCNINKGAI